MAVFFWGGGGGQPPPPPGRWLGDNSAPPVSFRASGGSSESRSHCANFSKPTLRSVSFISPGKSRFTGFCRLATGFVGWGPVWSVRDPTNKKHFGPEKSQRKPGNFYFALRFQRNVPLSKTEQCFFRFRPLVHPTGAVRTEKSLPFSGLQGGHHKIPARPTFVLHQGPRPEVRSTLARLSNY